MFNQITLVGNIGKTAPVMRYTPNGVAVCDFSLAVNKSHTDGNGVKVEETIWFKVTGWRKLAEIMAEYATPGRQVLVQGSLEQPTTWVDQNGNTRVNLGVTADTFRLLGGKPENGNGNGDHQAPAPAGPTAAEIAAKIAEEKIVF